MHWILSCFSYSTPSVPPCSNGAGGSWLSSGENQNLRRWSKQGDRNPQSLGGSVSCKDDLISVGPDGKGVKIKVLRSKPQFSVSFCFFLSRCSLLHRGFLYVFVFLFCLCQICCVLFLIIMYVCVLATLRDCFRIRFFTMLCLVLLCLTFLCLVLFLSYERNVEDEGGFSSLPSPVSSPLGQAPSVSSSPPQLAVVCHTKRTLNPISLLSKSTFQYKKIEPGCFRQNIIGVTIYASLGEDALIYSLNVVGVDVSDKPMPRGEIVVGDNSVTAGYFNNQAKTDDVYKRNGAEQAGVKYSDFSELCENGDAVNKVQQSLTKATKVEKIEIPAKIKLLPEPWTSESGLAQLLSR
ncbi:BnaC04g26780D [Brassica napus]|uniref:BnaC04g26780D protein n=1 Tax=Brassica napus TaxID=3708 RepID=A0A078FJI9_BRANA|nr:BnaC04g26780D [Brassica napus]